MSEKPRKRKRLYWLIALALLLLSGTLFYIEYHLARPIGEGARRTTGQP